MTWSYSFDPASSNKDIVRYLTGDTCFEAQQTTDEEIAWVLTEEPNVYFAAARVCRTISAMYARRANKSVGDLRIEYTSIRDQYDTLAKDLEARGATRGASIYVGGISKADKEAVEEDDDRVEPAFERDMHDAPGSIYATRTDPIDEV